MADRRPAAPSRAALAALALAPLALLAVLIGVLLRFGPAEALRAGVPPVEVLAFQSVVLGPEGIDLTVVNDGPDPVTIAQVQVDEAYWTFDVDPAGGVLDHLERARLHVPYPWVEGEAHELRLVTSTGLTFDHTIEVALTTPRPGWRFFGIFALVGLYVGVLPVALGLLWYPHMSRLSRRGLDFALALTVGLLLFLLVDAWHEGLEAAEGLPGSYQGVALLVFSALAAYLAIEGLGAGLKARGKGLGAAWVISRLVAVGIGLHNFGEGLAIGAAFALGEAALGTLLIVGFTLHNTTEGLAIVAPLAGERVGLRRLAWLGLVAGAPTIAGAWLGGFVYSPVWSTVFLGIGAGAIAQVVVQIGRSMTRQRPVGELLRSGAVAAGLVAGIAIMYTTGMLVG
jgi:zinc transporter ZupT